MEKVKPLSGNSVKIQAKKSKRRGILLIFAVLLPVVIIGVSFLYGNQLLTILSFTKVGAEPLYTMTYYGDYGFDEYLKTGSYSVNTGKYAPFQDQRDISLTCSVFSAKNVKGNPILGRNLDWLHRSGVLVFTNPLNGYKSVSLIDPFYCGYLFNDYTPVSFFDRFKLLGTPWMPFDGMNEYGLAIGEMSVPNADGGNAPRKFTIRQTDVIRLVLDHAKNVNEAITLISKYNISFDHGPWHYLLADASGNSVIIEFINGKMKVIRNTEPWQIATNFQIYGTKDGTLLCNRYATATQTLKKTNGVVSDNDAMKLLKDISNPITMWSVVYNMSTGDIQVRMGFDPARISQVKKFKLKMKI